MRRKKALVNIIFSLLLEVTNIVFGFIVPRIIIGSFGSDANGLVNSITSFIGYITVLQLGVGSVIKAALFKPLAMKDKDNLNVVVKASDVFFKKIGLATVIYIVILAVIFPFFIAKDFDTVYTASLVVIIGISTVFSYLFGITYQMLLEADQRSYIYSIIQILTIICNTIAVVILARAGATIHIVQAASAGFFVLRPLVLRAYARKKYDISLKIKYDKSVIAQRWDGFAHGLAYYIHSKTDIFVLTIFSTMEKVSIYGVYALVTKGLNAFATSIDKAVRSAFGNMVAKNESSYIKKVFKEYNVCFHMVCAAVFSTAAIVVSAFINIYVGDVKDANYNQPEFAVLIILAEFIYCLRMPYNSIIFAVGKFKETKNSAFYEAIINILISIVLVYNFGLIGVALGTLIAMVYRTVSFVIYLHKNILELDYIGEIKQYAVTMLTVVASWFLGRLIHMDVNNYFQWIIYSTCVMILVSIITIVMNLILNNNSTLTIVKSITKRIKSSAK